MMLAIVLFAVLADVACAQEVLFDPSASENCVLAKTGYARVDCVGASARACMSATPGADTTVGMELCLGRELAYWDARLNAAYLSLIADAEDSDTEMANLGSTVPRQEPALRDMQRTWIAFRDAACAYEYATWGGGSIRGPASLECAVRHTALQTLALEDRLVSQ